MERVAETFDRGAAHGKAALILTNRFMNCKLNKNAWQKKSRPPSGFATKNPKNPKKNHVFLI